MGKLNFLDEMFIIVNLKLLWKKNVMGIFEDNLKKLFY